LIKLKRFFDDEYEVMKIYRTEKGVPVCDLGRNGDYVVTVTVPGDGSEDIRAYKCPKYIEVGDYLVNDDGEIKVHKVIDDGFIVKVVSGDLVLDIPRKTPVKAIKNKAYIGKLMTIKYYSLTPDGKPFHPIALMIREDL